jgi:hypothetical protein
VPDGGAFVGRAVENAPSGRDARRVGGRTRHGLAALVEGVPALIRIEGGARFGEGNGGVPTTRRHAQSDGHVADVAANGLGGYHGVEHEGDGPTAIEVTGGNGQAPGLMVVGSVVHGDLAPVRKSEGDGASHGLQAARHVVANDDVHPTGRRPVVG